MSSRKSVIFAHIYTILDGVLRKATFDYSYDIQGVFAPEMVSSEWFVHWKVKEVPYLSQTENIKKKIWLCLLLSDCCKLLTLFEKFGQMYFSATVYCIEDFLNTDTSNEAFCLPGVWTTPF